MEKQGSSYEITKHFFDCKIAAYLLNPLKSDLENTRSAACPHALVSAKICCTSSHFLTVTTIRESLAANRDLADLSKALATINIHAEIDFSYDRAKLGNLFTPEAYAMFKQLSFKNPLHLLHSNPQSLFCRLLFWVFLS